MKKHEKKYIEVEGIMRACYDSFLKTGNKAYSEIISLAAVAPAADVAEVRHGRWADNVWVFTCSECGNDAGERWDYCPHCGAKMDEVEE